MFLTSNGTKMELKQYRKKLERDKSMTILSCSELIPKPDSEKHFKMYAKVKLEHPKKQKQVLRWIQFQADRAGSI